MVGAVTAPIYGHRVEFCDRVSATRGVAVHKLTKSTRDGVTAELKESLVCWDRFADQRFGRERGGRRRECDVPAKVGQAQA